MHFSESGGVVDGRWTALLDAIDLDELTADFEHRVRRLDWYREQYLTTDELHGSAVESFRAILRSMDPRVEREGATRELLSIAAHVGTTRARLGTPIEMLLHAIRIDFTVLFGHFVSIARAGDAPLLVSRTEEVWRTVETYAAQTHHAYIAERTRMQRETDAVRRARLTTLFAADGLDARALGETATALEVGVDDEFQVAVSGPEHVVDFRAALVQGELLGAVVFTHLLDEETVAFWQRDERPGAAAAALADRVRAVSCAFMERVTGLGEVAPAARTGIELLDVVVPGEGAVSMTGAWARLARRRLSAAGQRLDADIARALDAIPEGERERLVEAVTAYLATGSVQDAAERTFCHRNTLMNRLRRFRELTGVDATIPAEAARLVVAWS